MAARQVRACGGRRGVETVKELLLHQLGEAFERRAWHGPNLLGAIRGLDAECALWRPAPGRHNAWEIVLHCAHWKHRVRHRLVQAPRVAFPRPGQDWPRLPAEPTEAEWRKDVRLLRDCHRALTEAVASLTLAELNQPLPGLKVARIQSAAGMALHDVYHAGQIRLLRRLAAGGGQ